MKQKIQSEPMFLTDEFGGMGHEDALMREACSNIKSTRSNYVGNKRRLLPAIWKTISDNGIKFNRTTDAFGGSGAVSSLLAFMGGEIRYNDLLLSSCVQASCLLSESKFSVTPEEWKILSSDPQGENVSTLAREYYEEKFFTKDEAIFIDRYLGNLRLLFPEIKTNELVYDCLRTPFEKGKMKAIEASCALVGHINSVCFLGGRYYNGQTIAKKSHRLSHIKNDGIELHKNFIDSVSRLPKIQYPKGSSSFVYNMDVVDFLSKKASEGDLLYLDPPYGGESSDYAALYQFLEECVSGKRYDQDLERIKNASKFKSKNGYAELFKEVLSVAGGYDAWLVSFNRTSFASLDEIISLIENFGRKVDVKSASISYNYRKKRKTISIGEQIVGPNGETRRKTHIIGGTDDELLLLARRCQ